MKEMIENFFNAGIHAPFSCWQWYVTGLMASILTLVFFDIMSPHPSKKILPNWISFEQLIMMTPPPKKGKMDTDNDVNSLWCGGPFF